MRREENEESGLFKALFTGVESIRTSNSSDYIFAGDFKIQSTHTLANVGSGGLQLFHNIDVGSGTSILLYANNNCYYQWRGISTSILTINLNNGNEVVFTTERSGSTITFTANNLTAGQTQSRTITASSSNTTGIIEFNGRNFGANNAFPFGTTKEVKVWKAGVLVFEAPLVKGDTYNVDQGGSTFLLKNIVASKPDGIITGRNLGNIDAFYQTI